MNNRMKNLLKNAAIALSEGTDPFGDFFLTEHKVTAEEAIDMSEYISQIILNYLAVHRVITERNRP